MLAYAMNGEQMPLLNGFPLRLIVPGWYSTYWVKMLNDNVDTFRLTVHGHVNQSLSLSLNDILALPRAELVAINQCSGNSRGYFQPRVPGGEWSHGAMGNARWTGVRLKDVLDRAGVKAGAIQVRFNGMDEPVVPDAPDFMTSRCLVVFRVLSPLYELFDFFKLPKRFVEEELSALAEISLQCDGGTLLNSFLYVTESPRSKAPTCLPDSFRGIFPC